MSNARLFLLAAAISALAPIRSDAASLTLKTGRELLTAPETFIGRSVTVTSGFCVYDEPNVVCFGSETPFEVKAPSVSDPQVLAKLKDKCGDDLPGKEHDPTPACAFSFSFIPTSVMRGVGDYVLHDRVQSNKPLVLFEANSLTPRAR